MTQEPEAIATLNVIIDTREQQPWLFGDGVSVTSAALKTGDYSVAGLEGRICIERKSIVDLVTSLASGRARFEKEVRRMSRMDQSCVIVDGSIDELFETLLSFQGNADSIIGSINALHLYTGVPVFFYGSRVHAATFALNWLTQAARLSG